MRPSFAHLEKFRVHINGNQKGMHAGCFQIPLNGHEDLVCMAHDGAPDGQPDDPNELVGWEHVSCRAVMAFTIHKLPQEEHTGRLLTWPEMCVVKNYFWGGEETVVQFHPPTSKYCNDHPYVLHLWKQVGREYDLPPLIMVGNLSPTDVVLVDEPEKVALELCFRIGTGEPPADKKEWQRIEKPSALLGLRGRVHLHLHGDWYDTISAQGLKLALITLTVGNVPPVVTVSL